MSTSPEPLAVWDVRDPGWRHNWKAKTDWLKDRGLPVLKIYRVEFYLIDAPCAKIFCYALNDEGRRHWAPGHTREPHDHSGCDAAREEPRMIMLPDLPPAELHGV